MPIDLAQVDWLYVVVLAVFVFVATFVGNLLSFNHRSTAAVLSALTFAALFVFWTYYPHRIPLLPRTSRSSKPASQLRHPGTRGGRTGCATKAKQSGDRHYAAGSPGALGLHPAIRMMFSLD